VRKQKAAVSVATQMVLCSAWVQGRIPREATQWGRGAGLQCKAAMHTNGKNPLPRETRVSHFGGTTHFGSASTKGASRAVQWELQHLCTTDRSHTCHDQPLARTRADQDSRLIAGSYWPNEDPLPSSVACYMLIRLHRWYQGSERAHRDSSKYQHTHGTTVGAVDASDVVTQKQFCSSERTKWMARLQ
jgi:hypothetical protein